MPLVALACVPQAFASINLAFAGCFAQVNTHLWSVERARSVLPSLHAQPKSKPRPESVPQQLESWKRDKVEAGSNII